MALCAGTGGQGVADAVSEQQSLEAYQWSYCCEQVGGMFALLGLPGEVGTGRTGPGSARTGQLGRYSTVDEANASG